MGDFGRILRTIYGGHTFDVESVRQKDAVNRNEQGSVIGRERRFEFSGTIRGHNHQEVINGCQALFAALMRDPQKFDVIALDGALIHSIDPDLIRIERGFGPFVGEIEWGEATATSCTFKFPLVCVWQFPGGAITPHQIHKEDEMVERVVQNGIEIVRRSGRLQGPACSTAFQGLLPSSNGGTQVVTFSREGNDDDTDLKYRIEVAPLITALPAGVVDGEVQIDTTGEGFETRVVAQGHYVGTLAEQAARDATRFATGSAQIAPDVSRINLTRHREKRAEFSHQYSVGQFAAAADARILSWHERIKMPAWRQQRHALEYPGLDPLVVLNPAPPLALEYSGEVISLDRLIQVPDFVLRTPSGAATDYTSQVSETGDVTYEFSAKRERSTSWRYSAIIDAVPPEYPEPEGPR